MNFVLRYARRHLRMFILAFVCLSGEALCDLLQPTVMSKIVDDGIAKSRLDVIIHLGLTMFGIAALGALAATGRNYIASTTSQRMGHELRSDLFTRIVELSKPATDSVDTASLITRLTNDVTQIQNFTNGIMRVFTKAPLLGLGALVFSSILSPRLAIIVYTSVVIVFILIWFNIKLGYPLFALIQSRLDKVNSVMREYLSGIRVVRAFCNHSYEEARFKKVNDELYDATVRAMRVMAVFSPMVSFAVNIGIVAVLWVGGFIEHTAGDIEVGKVMAFINYMTQVLMSLTIISNAFSMFVRAKASAHRISEVFNLSQSSSVSKCVGKAFVGDSPISLHLERVTFAYEGSLVPTLRDICLKIDAHETIGIIGPTGCGKTTLANILLRLYEPSSGRILLGSLDLSEYDIAELRRIIAVVPQRSLLFSGSITENIAWGNKNASNLDIRRAAHLAQAHEFVEALPSGYESYVGQGGVNLSGGQRQRLCIARALIASPKLLILDDCTSSVDLSTEAKLHNAIREYSTEMICIVIAQRISSIMSLSKILVLEDGMVKGVGSHEKLLECCEVYRDIYHSQIGKVNHG